MLGINAESIEEEEARAQTFLTALNGELNHRRSILTEAEWNFVTNITDANQAIKDALAAENAKYIKVCMRSSLFCFYLLVIPLRIVLLPPPMTLANFIFL